MVEITESNANGAPTSVAQLSLPPTLITDDCLRTLFCDTVSAASLPIAPMGLLGLGALLRVRKHR